MYNKHYYNQDYQYSAVPQNLMPEIEEAVPFVPKPSDSTINGPFMEHNLLLNLGKLADFHMSFPDSAIEKDKTFSGRILEVARDHVVISNNEGWFALPMVYLNYIHFKEKPLIYKSRL